MDEQLEKLKWLVEHMPDINETVKHLVDELENMYKAFDELDSLNIDLKEEIGRQKEVLKFYGNGLNYTWKDNKTPVSSSVMVDGGCKAREILEMETEGG